MVVSCLSIWGLPSVFPDCFTHDYACSVGPGGFLEVTKMLPLLIAASPDYPSFHVVSSSLPGYAWLEGVRKKGLHAERYAEICVARFDMYYVLILMAPSLNSSTS
jgi:hypothetical protein